MHKYLGRSFFLPIVLLCLSSSLAANATETAANTGSALELDKTVWTWADQAGSNNAVFISRNVGGTWTKPETISTEGGVNVVPAVTSTDGTDLFAVWTNYTGSQAQLRYRQLKSGSWSEEKEYYTGLSSNTAASVANDNSNKVWMVWAGFNGVSDEIYYTTWNGSSFASAKAITANDVPDILPILGIDKDTGKPWVQWLQFATTGYQKYESTWNGSEWTKPIKVETNSKTSITQGVPGSTTLMMTKTAAPDTSQTKEFEIEIPSFVTRPESASVHIPGYTVRSLPVRSMFPIK